tara:strand:+ start:26665 stop:26859 length:195 start_codon:yes stop_codon:yes gene_type:complete
MKVRIEIVLVILLFSLVPFFISISAWFFQIKMFVEAFFLFLLCLVFISVATYFLTVMDRKGIIK